MNARTATILIIVSALLVGAVAAAVYYATINNSGTILTPASITSTPSSLNWDTEWHLYPGIVANTNVTLTNNGDEATRPLAMSTDLSSSIGTLTWNCTGWSVPAHGLLVANFVLTISETASFGSFTFTITIEGQ